MPKVKHLSRSIDYLGDLGAKLRDLRGYGTLARELIQNADDAPASCMSFDIRRDVLIVDNNGVFTDCEDVEADECPWSSDDVHVHRCDFHRFRLIGSGDKRLQEGTTGAFGIGFISVYQLTDRPELISAGRHWILHEEQIENERIEVCPGCPKCHKSDLPGTRFIFQFARDEQAPLRQALKADAVPEDVTTRLLQELERSLPVAILFLKSISAIQVKANGHLRLIFERAIENDTLIISQGESANDQVWHLLRGNFEGEASVLRRQYPNFIEDKRSAEVTVAVPTEELSSGLLCASLPTEERPGLPFHINAEFFPSNDRKHIILEDDYQSRWNREALLAAAQTVADATPQLTEKLGPKRFWNLVSALFAFRDTQRYNHARIWEAFWSAFEVALRKEAVVRTSSHNWVSANSGVAFLLRREESPNIDVLQGLGIILVSEELRPYQTILRYIGVPVFNVETLCIALTLSGLNKPVDINDLPLCLKSKAGREALWTEVDILLRRQANTRNAKRADEERLRAVSLAPAIEDTFRPCEDAYSSDSATVRLFESIGIGVPFLDQSEQGFEHLTYLCQVFEAADAIQALEEVDPLAIQKLWEEECFPLSRLIGWFESRSRQVLDDENLRRRLGALPIYPSANRLHPLTSLVLPGTFNDPLGLTRLVDVDALGGRRDFLFDLGAPELDFLTYVLEYISPALDDDKSDPTAKQDAVNLLADHLGELIDHAGAQQALSAIRLVICTDGEYRRAGDCYFPDAIGLEVLGNDVNIAVLPKERETAIRELLDWLGVVNAPRLRDIVQAVRRIADSPCSDSGVIRIRKIVDHLGQRFKELGELAELQPLRSIEWLPARRDRSQWHQPRSLHSPYRSFLFESQAEILDVPTPNSDLMEFLGVRVDLPPNLVVRHLLHCARHYTPVNSEVYRFLNDEADDPAIDQLRGTKCLWLGQAYRSPDHVLWGDHPFGRYRWRLADDLRGYGDLLEKIGVADAPDHEDALDVLLEIASEFGYANSPLDDEAYAVLMNCWNMLEWALNEDIIADESLRRLTKTKIIPNKDRLLYYPTRLFFENRAGLAAKFGNYLATNVIPRQLGTERAFLATGVRHLGSAVEIELLQNGNPVDDPDMMERLKQRRDEIARVLYARMDSNGVGKALERLNSLHCKSATTLVIQYCLIAFGPSVKSEPEPVTSLYQSDQGSLWATRPDRQIPWATLARELAIALYPEEDPGLFAAGLKDVLAAETTVDAATVLDELGFSQLDTSAVDAPPSQAAEFHLGTRDIYDDEGLSQRRTEGEVQLDISAKDETETSTKSDSFVSEDARRQLDIAQSPSSPIVEKPDPISTTGPNTPRTGRQPSGPVKQPDGEGAGRSRERGSAVRRTFHSYIPVDHGEEDGPDPDGLAHKERLDLENDAIVLILKHESNLEPTPTNNPGFDLTELGCDGEPTKWVEVKAMKGTLQDRPVSLSRTQFECAQAHQRAYWLYIVENADTPKRARVVRIQDPAGKARTFTFDRGWLAVAEDPLESEV